MGWDLERAEGAYWALSSEERVALEDITDYDGPLFKQRELVAPNYVTSGRIYRGDHIVKVLEEKAKFHEDMINKEMTQEETVKQHMDPEFYERQAANMLQRAEVLRSVPMNDPFEDEALITFTRQYRGQGFLYAAIKAAGSWHCTGGREGQQLKYATWQSLLEFIGIDAVDTIFVLTDGSPLAKWVKDHTTTKAVDTERRQTVVE